MEKSMEMPQKLKIRLSFAPAILLLFIDPKEMNLWYLRVIWTFMLTAILFTTDNVKNWLNVQKLSNGNRKAATYTK